jgi:WD40 repeat protein
LGYLGIEIVDRVADHSSIVRSVAWTHDATRLASVSDGKTIKIWDTAAGQCISTLVGHGKFVLLVAWTNDA